MELPLFPLHLVLFPGRPLALHLFEHRYRTMLADCLAGSQSFGVVAIRSGREVASLPDMFRIGTVAEIEQVDELPDGRYDIVTRGVHRFVIDEMIDGKPYCMASVELLEDRPQTGDEVALANAVRTRLLPYLSELGAPAELLDRVPDQPEALSWLAAAAVQVEVPRQQSLLEIDSVCKRLQEALRILRRENGIMRHFGTVGSLRPAGPGGAELN